MTKIGPIELGSVPRIAVPLTDGEIDQIPTARQWADIVELRVDMFADLSPAHVADTCRRAVDSGAGLLVTVRSQDQGGASELDDQQRLALFEAALPHAHAFDVELRSPICRQIIDLASQNSLTSIASHHDFERTPARDELDEIVRASAELGADIAKLAVTANDGADRNRVLDVLRSSDNGVIAIAMGPHGAASRVFFPLCGSLITYGFLNDSVAPGQMSIRELRAELARYLPGLRATRC